LSADGQLLTRSIDALASRQDLSADQTAAVLGEIMRGNASEIQIAAFLIALRTKGETVQELTGLARTMRAMAASVAVARRDLLDTAGTGGGRRTFNVSTTAALIAAGAGCTVAKHGNRSATGLSGSADVLEALGARIDLTPSGVARCIEEVGFGFMFAPAHHQATRFVIPVRSELAVRTIFNFLGPLTNPAGATRQLIGVSDAAYLKTMAGALASLGTEHALLVSSLDGLDELSVCAPTRVFEVTGDGAGAGDPGRRSGPQRRHHPAYLRRRARPGARCGGAQRRRRDLRRGRSARPRRGGRGRSGGGRLRGGGRGVGAVRGRHRAAGPGGGGYLVAALE
jgi:anthranilate phosphoribosyltransferase